MKSNKVLKYPVTSLNLTSQLYNSLVCGQYQMKTIEDLLSVSEEELLLLRNFGKFSLQLLNNRLKKLGYKILNEAELGTKKIGSTTWNKYWENQMRLLPKSTTLRNN